MKVYKPEASLQMRTPYLILCEMSQKWKISKNQTGPRVVVSLAKQKSTKGAAPSNSKGAETLLDEQRRRIANTVQRKYKSLSIDKLDTISRSFKDILNLAKVYKELSKPTFHPGFVDGLRPVRTVSLYVSYVDTLPSGVAILRVYEENCRQAVLMSHDPKEKYKPYHFSPSLDTKFCTLEITKKLNPEKAAVLDKIRKVGLRDLKYSKIYEKLREAYLSMFAEFFTLLAEHGFKKEVEELLTSPDLEISLSIPEKAKPKPKPRYHVADAKQIPSDEEINAGDRVYCQLSSVIVIENTFSCVNRNHVMVPVILEVLLKHKGDDLPCTRELAAYYCQQCKRIFLYTTEFYRIYNLFKDSDYQFFNKFMHEGRLYGFSPSTSGWAAESILKMAGYEVSSKSNLTQRERIEILLALNRIGVSYHRIISYLNHFIEMNGAAVEKDMSQAVMRWESDIEVMRDLYTRRIAR